MNADVVIVGSGISGALVATHLARMGIDTLIIEAGPRIDRATTYANWLANVDNGIKAVPESPYAQSPWAPHPTVTDLQGYYVQDEATGFRSTYERVVGGTTWHWLGTSLRLVPDDFQLRSTFGVGVDWPISYDDLEPWYGRAEKALGVAAPDGEDLGSPRSTPPALPPIPMSYLDKQVAKGFDGMSFRGVPLQVAATPQARNSVWGHNRRPRCCGAHNCIPICPIGAKYDATVHIDEAEARGARVVPEAVVYDMDVGSNGLVTAVMAKRPDGTDLSVTGRVFVLAANAIETAKILLMSAHSRFPAGVANSSDQVGRNLMDHPVFVQQALTNDPIYPARGPISTAGVETTRSGSWRSQFASFRIEIQNSGQGFGGPNQPQVAEEMIRDGLIGTDLLEAYRDKAVRLLSVDELYEQLPEPSNRIVPDYSQRDAIGIPRPKMHWTIDEYVTNAHREVTAVIDQLFTRIGTTEVRHNPDVFGAGHLMGTFRMGDDPKTSVVDKDLRTHDHANLFLEGSGVFPTAGAANPTLTIAALALRSVDAIVTQLRKTP